MKHRDWNPAILCPHTTAAFIFATFVTDTMELRQRLDRKVRTDLEAFTESTAITLTGMKQILAQSGLEPMQDFRSALAYLNERN